MKLRPITAFACLLVMPLTLATAADSGWHSVNRDGQPMVTGSGRIVTQQRPIGNFRAIELKGSANLHVRVGVRPSLTIRADDNILANLTSQVVGGTLVLDSRGSYRTRTTPHITVTVPDLASLQARGSGNADIVGLANRRFELALRGSGDINASGRTGAVEVALQGSGNADLRNLAAGRAEATLAGSGNIWVRTNGPVNARAFGSGNVYVLGRPATLSVREAGSGRVIVRSR